MLVFHESAIPPATTDPDPDPARRQHESAIPPATTGPDPDPARGEVFGVVQDPDVTTLPVRKQGALFRARWWRVVLDEVYQTPSQPLPKK